MRARRSIGYEQFMAREKSGLIGVGLMVAALLVVLVIFWFVREYAAG